MADDEEETYEHASCLEGIEELHDENALRTLVYEIHEEKHYFLDESLALQNFIAGIASALIEMGDETRGLSWLQSIGSRDLIAAKLDMIAEGMLSAIDLSREDLKEAEAFAEIVNNFDKGEETP